MNFRKFISGVSALTIAASAFAAMTVTASAAEPVEVDFIGTSETAVTDPAAEGWTNVKTETVTEVEKPAVGETASITSTDPETGDETTTYYYPTYVSGTVLRNSQRKSTVTSEYALPASVDNGTVTFKANVMTSSGNAGYYDGGQIQLRNSAGTAVATISVPANTAGRLSLNGKYDSSYTVNPRAGAFGFNVALTIDLDNNKATAVFDTINSNHVRVADSTVTANITADSDIASLVLYQSSTRSSNTTTLNIDDIQFYANTVLDSAETVKVSFTADGTEVASKTIDVSAQDKAKGETVSYYVPAYVKDEAGNIYKVSSRYSRTATATGKETAVTEAVTLVEGAVQYAEFDGVATYVNRDDYASNGQVAKGSQEITVQADGVYTLTVAAGVAINGSSGRTYDLYVKDGAEIVTGYGPGGYVAAKTYDNVKLKAGDVIVFKANNSYSALDYILFTKTADLPEDPDFAIDLGNAEVVNGTVDYASEVASVYVATVSNNGGEGSTSKVTVTVDGTAKDNELVLTLAKNANALIGIILNNVNADSQTVSAAIE